MSESLLIEDLKQIASDIDSLICVFDFTDQEPLLYQSGYSIVLLDEFGPYLDSITEQKEIKCMVENGIYDSLRFFFNKIEDLHSIIVDYCSYLPDYLEKIGFSYDGSIHRETRLGDLFDINGHGANYTPDIVILDHKNPLEPIIIEVKRNNNLDGREYMLNRAETQLGKYRSAFSESGLNPKFAALFGFDNCVPYFQ